ncbi:MAG: XdhC/CoxI family protein [Chloroflexota bacterium]
MLEVYQELLQMISQKRRGVIATVITSQGSAPRKAGAKMLIREDGTTAGTVGGGSVEHQVVQKARVLMESRQPEVVHFDLSGQESQTMICGGQMDILFEPVLPPETLYLFGAGHISQYTARLGRMLGFRVVVIDPRAEYNHRERFPDADSLLVEPYEKAFSQLAVAPEDYLVIMTSGHVSDEKCLHFAVGTKARYIGMIGSNKKVREVKERLLAKAVLPEQLERVHAPLGIEIGAETPEEIAVSILAELIKVRRS